MLFDPSLLPLILILVVIVIVAALLKRYRRCPSDKILVVYGSTGKGSAKCVHGGGVFVWPIIQDYAYLNLTPISIEANLIRMNTYLDSDLIKQLNSYYDKILDMAREEGDYVF